MQYLQRESHSLKEENKNKRRIGTVLHQNNKLLKLNHEIYNKNNLMHYQEKSFEEYPKRNDFQIASKTATKEKSNNYQDRIWIIVITIIASFHLIVSVFYEDSNNDDNESMANK